MPFNPAVNAELAGRILATRVGNQIANSSGIVNVAVAARRISLVDGTTVPRAWVNYDPNFLATPGRVNAHVVGVISNNTVQVQFIGITTSANLPAIIASADVSGADITVYSEVE